MLCFPNLESVPSCSAVFIAKAYSDKESYMPDDIAKAIVEAPGFSNMTEEMLRKNTKYAQVAGDILKNLYYLDDEGEKNASLYNARQEVKASYDGAEKENRQENFGWSNKKLKEAWRNYKPISPLWAATRSMSREWGGRTESLEFFKTFFSISEAFADFGENLLLHNKAKQRREPLFKKGEVWRVPKEIKQLLPKGKAIPFKGKLVTP